MGLEIKHTIKGRPLAGQHTRRPVIRGNIALGGNINFVISGYFVTSDFVIMGVYYSGLSL